MMNTSAGSDGSAGSYDANPLLAATAAFGDFFVLTPGNADTGMDLADLVGDPTTALAFVERTQSAIALAQGCDESSVPVRMAASSFHLNVVSRLISPVVGAAVMNVAMPLLTATSVRWMETGGHSPQFFTVGVECQPASDAAASAELISASLLTTIVGPLNDALSSAVSLSKRVSWGNAISAANGAVTVMAMSRPDVERAGRALVRALLDVDPLRDAGRFVADRFFRQSCCLFYQTPVGGLCGDCVLAVAHGPQRTPVD